jgi:hypothetical protein
VTPHTLLFARLSPFRMFTKSSSANKVKLVARENPPTESLNLTKNGERFAVPGHVATLDFANMFSLLTLGQA